MPVVLRLMALLFLTRSDVSLASPSAPASVSLGSAAGVAWTLTSASVPTPLAALVPGDVNDDLERAGLLPDLHFGTNSMEASWVMREPWTYAASFATPTALGAPGATALLRFEGVDYQASSVSLNGVALGGHVGSFEPFEFDVSSTLRIGGEGDSANNSLVIVIAAAPAALQADGVLFTRDAYADNARTTYSAGAAMRQTMTRWKSAIGNGGGVDFATPAWPLGVWRDVLLRVSAPAPLRLASDSLIVLPAVSAPFTSAALLARISLVGAADGVQGAALVWHAACETNASAPSATLSASVTGAGLAVAEIQLDAPSLWFPAGYGRQDMYSLTVELWFGGALVDMLTTRFGVRELVFVDNDDNTGSAGWLYNDYGVRAPCDDDLREWCAGDCASFPGRNSSDPGSGGLPSGVRTWTMQVNGRRVFARGANWVPVSVWPGRRGSRDRARLAVGMAAAANLVFLRVWGGALVESQAFLDACDDAGLLLLVEMPKFSPRADPSLPGVLAGEEADTRAAVLQMINHPAVAQYGFANEQYVNASWSHLFAQFAATVAALDGTRPARWANPSPAAQRHGPYWFNFEMMSGHPVSYDVFNRGCSDGTAVQGCRPGSPLELDTGNPDPFEWGEVGAGGLSDEASLARFLPPASLESGPNASDPSWVWHNAFSRWPPYTDTWLGSNAYRWLFDGGNASSPMLAGGLPAEVRASQLAQAEAYRYIFSSSRWRKWHRSAVSIWTFNEPFPNAAHHCVLDYYGAPKHAFYAARRANAALAASLQYDNIWQRSGASLNASLWIDSELSAEWRGGMEVAYFRASGRELHRDLVQIAVPPSASIRLQPPAFSLPADAEGGTILVRLRLISGGGRGEGLVEPAFDDTYAFGIVPPGMPECDVTAPLGELMRLPVTALAVALGASGAVSVANTGSAIAAFVKLTALDASGERVGFVAFSDSFLVLEPGELRNVSLLAPGGLDAVASVAAEAWNAPPVQSRRNSAATRAGAAGAL